MKWFYIVLILDIVILMVMIKVIFKTYGHFLRSLTHHFFPDEIIKNPLEKFATENDSRHKINILYAVILFLAITSSVLYFFLIYRP